MNRKTTSFTFGLINNIKLLFLVALVFILSIQSYAQVTVSGGTVAAGPYTTIKAAADAISANPVTGAITVDVVAGHTETLPSRIDFTATGTSTNTITFQKSGAGANPVITAYTGTNLNSSATTIDGMWSFSGSDYIIIDGIDLNDPNTTASGFMEYGYGFFKASTTDGCNNNIIRNCTIDLNRNNVVTGVGPRSQIGGATGILLVNATATLTGSALTATTIDGASSNNLFERNTIQDCNDGICIIGSPITVSPYTNADFNNTIGGSAGNGNSIINFGGGTTPTAACAAVLHKDQWSANISYNTINNNNAGGTGGINHATSNRGIWLFNASPGASVDVNFNTLQIRGGSSTTAINWVIDCEMATTGTGNTININNNIFQACQTLTATSGAFHCVWLNTIASTVNVNDNNFNGFQYSGTGTSGAIFNNLSGIGTLNMNRNKVNTMTFTGTGTKGLLYYTASTTVSTLNANNNRVSNVTINTATFGTAYGIITGSPTNATLNRDTIENCIATAPTSSHAFYGLYSSGGTNKTFTNNIIRSFGSPGTGVLAGIYDISASGTVNISNNTVNDFATYPAVGFSGGGTRYGIYKSSGVGTCNVNNNQVYSLSTTGGTSGTFYSMFISGGTTTNNEVYNNIIRDISTGATGGTIYGLYNSSTGTVNNMYNNFISGISAPLINSANSISGMILGSGTYNVFNNTIYLGNTGTLSSSGASFGISGLYMSSTTGIVNLKNNIININANASGTSWNTVLRRVSGTASTKPSTLTASNNIYYINPSNNNLIYGEGTGAVTAVTNAYYISSPGTHAVTGAIADPNFNTSCSTYKNFMLESSTFSENNLTA